MKIPVALVDDRSQNRISLSERLNYSEDIQVIFTAANGDDFLQQMKSLPLAQLPKVVLMDIEMPGMNGIEAVRIGMQLYPAVKFLMLTVFDDDDKIFEAIKAGASGYLLKDERISSIIECICQLTEIDAAPMSPSIARKALDMLAKASFKGTTEAEPMTQHQLSEREIEILKLLVDGYDYRETAEKLILSTHTVRKHIANIYNKLHVTSKAQAIKLAMSNKIV